MSTEAGEPALSTGGFTVLDGAALVAGAAVAAVHIRGAIRGELLGTGWIVLWLTFLWVAVTAAGPFLYLFRLYLRPLPDYPQTGDRLWGLLGLPWLVTTPLQGPPQSDPGASSLLPTALTLGLGFVSMVALVVVWRRWVMVSPAEANERFTGNWTNRIGLILAIAWPVQWGLGMVIAG